MRDPVKFGNYYLIERINIGGMAEVFKAVSYGVEGFERLYAVKRVLPNIAEDQEFIDMFIDEAKIAVQLNHANIGQIFELGRDGAEGNYFIAMEFVQGKDLRALFDRARKRGEQLDVAMCCHIVKEVCEALEYAHNKKGDRQESLGLVHRDVSPQNIIVSYDGEVKLIDFGIAKAAGKASKTQSGILKGKFGYMSPEQVRGRPIDRRSDLFSLGVVLFELLTLERCFQGESDFSVLEKVRNCEIRRPASINRNIPPELERIVLKALSRDPAERFQSAAEFQDALQKFLYQSGAFYARKDLAQYMRRTFDADIRSEQRKLAEFREYAQRHIPEARRAPASLPPPAAEPAAADPAQFSPQLPSLSWDEDEIETAIWDRSPSQLIRSLEVPAGRVAEPIVAGARSGPAAPPTPSVGPPEPTPPVRTAAPAMNPTELMLPGAPRRSAAAGGRLVALGVIGAVTVALALAAVYHFTRKASLVIESREPSAVRVEIDGRVVHDAETPVELRDLSPGPHRVRISAPGYLAAEQVLELRSNEQDRLVVTLRPEPAESVTGLDIQTRPTGARVFVDGEPAPDVTPIRITGLRPGVRALRIEKPGFLPWKGTVEAREGVVVNVQPIELLPERVTVQFLSDPSGAKITLRFPDGREAYVGETSVTFEGLDNRGGVTVIAERPGYERLERRLPQYDRSPATEFLQLESAEARPRPDRPAVARRSSPTPRPPARPGLCTGEDCPPPRSEDAPPRVVAAAPTEPATPQEGVLKLLAKPPARVQVRGQDLGWTPVLGHRLPPGTYRVKLVRDLEPRYTREFDVQIFAGQTTFRKHIEPMN